MSSDRVLLINEDNQNQNTREDEDEDRSENFVSQIFIFMPSNDANCYVKYIRKVMHLLTFVSIIYALTLLFTEITRNVNKWRSVVIVLQNIYITLFVLFIIKNNVKLRSALPLNEMPKIVSFKSLFAIVLPVFVYLVMTYLNAIHKFIIIR